MFFGSGAPIARFRSTGRVMPQLLSVMDVCSQRNVASAVSLCPGRLNLSSVYKGSFQSVVHTPLGAMRVDFSWYVHQ